MIFAIDHNRRGLSTTDEEGILVDNAIVNAIEVLSGASICAYSGASGCVFAQNGTIYSQTGYYTLTQNGNSGHGAWVLSLLCAEGTSSCMAACMCTADYGTTCNLAVSI